MKIVIICASLLLFGCANNAPHPVKIIGVYPAAGDFWNGYLAHTVIERQDTHERLYIDGDHWGKVGETFSYP